MASPQQIEAFHRVVTNLPQEESGAVMDLMVDHMKSRTGLAESMYAHAELWRRRYYTAMAALIVAGIVIAALLLR